MKNYLQRSFENICSNDFGMYNYIRISFKYTRQRGKWGSAAPVAGGEIIPQMKKVVEKFQRKTSFKTGIISNEPIKNGNFF